MFPDYFFGGLGREFFEGLSKWGFGREDGSPGWCLVVDVYEGCGGGAVFLEEGGDGVAGGGYVLGF